MVQSMTGYGKATCEVNGKTILIEIKSLNSKQLDLNAKIPSVLKELELEFRNEIQRRLLRGKIELNISFEGAGKETVQHINTDVFSDYLKQLNETSAALNIAPPADPWPLLLRMPDVIKAENLEFSPEAIQTVKEAFNTAIDRFIEFRIQEGAMLKGVFEKKLSRIESLLEEVKRYEGERLETIKSRITDSLAKLDSAEYDKNRFEQEMIYYIEKLDINEEKSRLANHCLYFRTTMEEEAGQGKKLGFISQEIGREVNTLGSKSNHTEMQKIVVCMKDELEQIKEQVLNVL
ncbi:MAG: YicC/YloC family endoribonuclease [Bacteroidota bacterium]|nr:YicC/YloC family endoribonuclease [Bacteroidota bacterium]